jgi:hypothetical protein
MTTRQSSNCLTCARSFVSALLCLFPLANLQSAEPPASIDVSNLPAQVVEDVVVPVPSEVFAVLDKLGKPDWKSELTNSSSATELDDRPQIALLLGTVIADGFIAVQAQDSERVKDTGREVLRLASAIGVRESVVRRSKSIIDAAESKNWPSVRVELDKALTEVRAAMIELNDDKLAQLVSLGGWLRGTEAVTSIVSKSFSNDSADLLHQPILVSFFSDRLTEMPSDLRGSTIIGKIGASLGEIKPLVDPADGSSISLASVQRIHVITTDLVSEITQRAN